VGICSIASSRRFRSSLARFECLGSDRNSDSWNAEAYTCPWGNVVLQRTIRRLRALSGMDGESIPSDSGRFLTIPSSKEWTAPSPVSAMWNLSKHEVEKQIEGVLDIFGLFLGLSSSDNLSLSCVFEVADGS
jgi:hypothetical protein